MAEPSRRGFLGGLIAAVTAPVIIKTPGLLMPIKPLLFKSLEFDGVWLEEAELLPPINDLGPIAPVIRNNLLTINMITREAINQWINTNVFLRNISEEYRKDFAFVNGMQWGERPNARQLEPQRVSFRDWSACHGGGGGPGDYSPVIGDENRSEVGGIPKFGQILPRAGANHPTRCALRVLPCSAGVGDGIPTIDGTGRVLGADFGAEDP